jgi:hypothetical protein
MNGPRKSDGLVVPVMPPNKALAKISDTFEAWRGTFGSSLW